MTRQSTGTERDWLRSASVPPPEFTSKATCTREDLFRELDFLVEDLTRADELLRTNVRRRVTRIRALASTLVPKQAKLVCGYAYMDGPRVKHVCGQQFTSESARAAHRELIHNITEGVA